MLADYMFIQHLMVMMVMMVMAVRTFSNALSTTYSLSCN